MSDKKSAAPDAKEPKTLKARRSVEEMANREKINIGHGREDRENAYYAKVSKGYRTMKIIALILLICYLGVMLGMYHNQITYENLMYLIKDLDTDVSSGTSAFADINFDETSRLAIDLYRDRLAVCSADEFRLYNTAGALEVEYTHSMSSPAVASGDKYVMAYDIGGTSYSVYTTIARVLTKQTEYEIQSGAMSKSGEFALTTRARENRYVVSFYDRNFRELSKIYKDKYVMTCALSDDGKNYCVASFDVVASDFVCDVMYGSVKSDKAESVSVNGALPFKAEFFSDGSFAVICDTSVLFFSDKGELTNTYKLTGLTLTSADVCADRVMLLGKENIVGDTNTVTVLGKDGSEIMRTQINGKINSAALGENYVFAAVSGKAERISFDGEAESEDCPLNVTSLVPTGGAVSLCTPTGCTTRFADIEDTAQPLEQDTSNTEAERESEKAESESAYSIDLDMNE